MKRSLFCLTSHDYECIDHTAATHGHIRRADAVRFAILQQAERSRGASGVRNAQPLADSCREAKATNPDGRPLRRWHMLLSPALDAELDGLVTRHGFGHKAEAVRFVIRSQAYVDGFAAQEFKARARPKKRAARRAAPRRAAAE